MWKHQFQAFAKYNQNMNTKLYATAKSLSPQELERDRGAFFKSVLGTLQHILVADIIWMRRFQMVEGIGEALQRLKEFPAIGGLDHGLYGNFEELSTARQKMDQLIATFIEAVPEANYSKTFSYKNMAGKEFENPLWISLTHFFNHQTHHRGQATTLLTQSGLDVGVTDFPVVIKE